MKREFFAWLKDQVVWGRRRSVRWWWLCDGFDREEHKLWKRYSHFSGEDGKDEEKEFYAPIWTSVIVISFSSHFLCSPLCAASPHHHFFSSVPCRRRIWHFKIFLFSFESSKKNSCTGFQFINEKFKRENEQNGLCCLRLGNASERE